MNEHQKLYFHKWHEAVGVHERNRVCSYTEKYQIVCFFHASKLQ